MAGKLSFSLVLEYKHILQEGNTWAERESRMLEDTKALGAKKRGEGDALTEPWCSGAVAKQPWCCITIPSFCGSHGGFEESGSWSKVVFCLSDFLGFAVLGVLIKDTSPGPYSCHAFQFCDLISQQEKVWGLTLSHAGIKNGNGLRTVVALVAKN